MSDWDEKAVFLTFLGLPEDQREAFLEKACPDDVARDRIRTLLRHHGEASEDFLTERTKTMSEPERPTMIEEFRILHRLGEGGMGVVYLAEDTVLGRKVALKILARHLSGSEQALARFREEARSAAALKHPAIVPVFKFGRDGDDAFLVSELVEGPTLASVIEEKRRTMTGSGAAGMRDWHRHCAEMVAVIADALDSAHRAEIVHRDVKPSNILIDPDRGPRLTDFGIAKHLTEENRNRHTGIIGSCHYMSPEQAAIADTLVDQRSDIFSLGVVLYEMLALRLPFDGKTIHQVLQAVIHREPPRLRTVNRQIPADLETICHKAIEKSPRDRYQSAAHVAADLRCFLRGDPILAAPPNLVRRARRWISRHRIAVIAAFSASITLTAGGLGWQLKRASDQSMAWLSVFSDKAGRLVYAQSVDPTMFEIAHEARLVGKTPMDRISLSPGQYRLTICSPESGAFAEFNVLALMPGWDARVSLWAYSDSAESEYAGNDRGASSLLCGKLAPARGLGVEGMARVDAGSFRCGQKNTKRGLLREQKAILPAFFVDEREVSNAEYRSFANATGAHEPFPWKEFGYDPALADRPVVGIRIEDAEAYARWRGKRLPTMLEWQAAARGRHGWYYPWGRKALSPDQLPPFDKVMAEVMQTREARDHYGYYKKYTVSCDTRSPITCSSSLLQVFGNVREITGSIVTTSGASGIAMGRSWFDPPALSKLSDVWTFPVDSFSFMHGFRCAKSAAPPGG